ncbi:MAG: glycine zipper 2TM domain-containing protein [Candidatus Competibacteraceae bacterium]|nr:glycine zipper 2TM domain-containing protein [Candidatus Competibacteraceae bacterium]MBK7983654.1 glycine zipper 2TM domain-containing protein [Candidatus Competibacteraceae bacterium]MBK8897804.1 glycine zipper 2TM domain-containing protein [Candidatus Competibacteraceae bacterium]MBK8961610.1 glycine zipper 2TM domain-containing protein [Candidatus Competibacteraceae bacterium]MBK9950835.1 glycine zipper 2TM domain-containing protein [Candidatus Competibacteraceae bacterium]
MKALKTMAVVVMLASGLMLGGGCASSLSGGAYSRAQARGVQEVRLGYVESVRDVLIEGTQSGVGTMGGAALGGLAGSNLGKGNGRAAGAIGGAIVGGLVGSTIEQNATRQPGLEITVRLDSGRLLAITQAADEPFNRGDRVRLLTGYDGTARIAHY